MPTVSVSPTLNDNQILRAIESISGRFITCCHDEAKGYAFKYTDGTWGFSQYDFVHDIAKSYNEEGKYLPFG